MNSHKTLDLSSRFIFCRNRTVFPNRFHDLRSSNLFDPSYSEKIYSPVGNYKFVGTFPSKSREWETWTWSPRKSRNRSCIGNEIPGKGGGRGTVGKRLETFPWAAFVQDYRIPGGFRIDQMRKSRSEERGNVCRTRAGIY